MARPTGGFGRIRSCSHVRRHRGGCTSRLPRWATRGRNGGHGPRTHDCHTDAQCGQACIKLHVRPLCTIIVAALRGPSTIPSRAGRPALEHELPHARRRLSARSVSKDEHWVRPRRQPVRRSTVNPVRIKPPLTYATTRQPGQQVAPPSTVVRSPRGPDPLRRDELPRDISVGCASGTVNGSGSKRRSRRLLGSLRPAASSPNGLNAPTKQRTAGQLRRRPSASARLPSGSAAMAPRV